MKVSRGLCEDSGLQLLPTSLTHTHLITVYFHCVRGGIGAHLKRGISDDCFLSAYRQAESVSQSCEYMKGLLNGI